MKTTKIEWTESTGNPSVGCSKVTAGCKNCYAETMARRLQAKGVAGYENGFEFKVLPDRLTQPLSVKKPTMFFVNSMSDLFHKKMPFDFLNEIFNVMKNTPQHHYQILTKREKIMQHYFLEKKAPDNVGLGVTVEHANTKHRIDYLRNIDAKVRFLSIEPLIDDVGELDLSGIHGVIVGGESGVCARPMKPEGLQNIQQQCKEQKVAFFFKQGGTGGEDGVKRSKKENGKLINGIAYQQMPCQANQTVIISQPMRGKTEEQVRAERVELVKELTGQGYTVVDTVFPNFTNEGNVPLKYLAKSLEFIADADGVYFMDGWQDARGCRIEHHACVDYGIKILRD